MTTQSTSSSRKRTFASCSDEEIRQLECRQYASNTVKGQQCIEKLFISFINTKGFTDIPTCPIIINGILSEFWPSLRTLKNEEYSASTLQTFRHLLRNVFTKTVNIDILADIRLKSQRDVFDNYLRGLKERGKGSVNHFQEIPKEEMRQITSRLSLTNPTELQYLSWWFVQLFFCKRGIENTQNMQKNDLVFEEVQSKKCIRLGKVLKTKNHQELNEDARSGGRICEIPGFSKCPVNVLTLYLSKLNPQNNFLWQYPSTSFIPANNCWYQNKSLGHNKIARMMKSISNFCSLSHEYTNHCVRVSACTLLGELGFTDLDVQSVSKHKSVDSLGLYKRTKDARKMEMATLMAKSIGLEEEGAPVLSHRNIQMESEHRFEESPALRQTITTLEYLNHETTHSTEVNNDTTISLPSAAFISDFMADYDFDKEMSKICQNVEQPSTSEEKKSDIIEKAGKVIVIRDCSNFTIQM
jgi:hypothetical protein